MLEIDQIPQSEPELSVGIVLPQDGYSNLTVDISPDDCRFFAGDEEIEIAADLSHFRFKVDGEDVRLDLPSAAFIKAQSFRIEHTPVDHIAAKSGICVHDVIAGRDFHWRKKIPVYLLGKIEVKAVGGVLVLINHLPFEIYLMCVATSEMGAACPPALIEAQTIAARSWMLANIEKKHRHLGMDVCNDDCCQRYQGTNFLTQQSIAGAQNTWGNVAMAQQEICDARYSKSCGGMMESFETIWGDEKRSYLQIKRDWQGEISEPAGDLTEEQAMRKWLHAQPESFCSPKTIAEDELVQYLGSVDEKGRYYRWQFEFSQNELCETLNETLSLGAVQIHRILPRKRGGSGRVQAIGIHYVDECGHEMERIVSGDVAIRAVLHKKFLYSAAFVIDHLPTEAPVPEKFIIRGAGWGHGVGLCQIGALGMALKKYSCEQIIAHYYPGSQLVKLY